MDNHTYYLTLTATDISGVQYLDEQVFLGTTNITFNLSGIDDSKNATLKTSINFHYSLLANLRDAATTAFSIKSSVILTFSLLPGTITLLLTFTADSMMISLTSAAVIFLIPSIFPHSTPSSYERIPFGLPTPSPLMKAIFSCLMKIPVVLIN